MLCQRCQKRTANVHFTKIVNNNKVEMYLCEQCANEEGQFNLTASINPFNIGNFLSSFMNFDSGDTTYVPHISQGVVCKKCGMSFEDFQKQGKLGCSECYKTYKDRLKPILKRLHGGVAHSGKAPARISESKKVSDEINRLKQLLNEAIQREEYEKAAEIRDKIRAIENKNN